MTLPVRALCAALVTFLATVVATALVAVALTAPSASAAGRNWGTIQRLDDASLLQACKVPAGDSAWRVWARVQNARGDQWVKGTVTVLHDDARTDRRWASGRIAAGRVSAPGSVLVPRRADWTIEATLSAAQMGGGGEYYASGLRNC